MEGFEFARGALCMYTRSVTIRRKETRREDETDDKEGRHHAQIKQNRKKKQTNQKKTESVVLWCGSVGVWVWFGLVRSGVGGAFILPPPSGWCCSLPLTFWVIGGHCASLSIFLVGGKTVFSFSWENSILGGRVAFCGVVRVCGL